MEYLYNLYVNAMASLPNTGEESYLHIVIILAVLGLLLLGLTFWLRKRQKKDIQGPPAPKGPKGRGKANLKPPQKPKGPGPSAPQKAKNLPKNDGPKKPGKPENPKK